MAANFPLDSLAYQNRLRYLPPGQKLVFTAILFLLAYLSPPVNQLFLTLWLGVWVVVYARIPIFLYLRLLGIPLGFYLLSLPALVVSFTSLEYLTQVQGDIWQSFPLGGGFIYLSQQGREQAGEILLRLIALTSCFYFLLLTTPFPEIIVTLHRLGLPSLLLDLLALMYRFIFLLLTTAEEIITAQKARNGYGNWQRSLVSLSLVTAQLLGRSLENYRQFSLGLTSRGFTDKLNFYQAQGRYRSNFRYILEALFGCLFLVLGIINNGFNQL
jgi:cobalt/nickel transport system permease protein